MRLFRIYVPALGCAGAMVLCMRMMRGRDAGQKFPAGNDGADLQEENARLRAQLELASRGEPTREE